MKPSVNPSVKPSVNPSASPSQPIIWNAAVRLDDVPETGRHVELEASADVRAALASVQARVRQICVVTLEPVVSAVDEEIDVDFAPPRERPRERPRELPRAAKGEVRKSPQAVDPEDDDGAQRNPDEPEPLTGNSLDLGALATEFLILGIDPYPRKSDAAFEPPTKSDDAAAHPFAALEALSKKGTVKE
jgi:hypothetical protein